jgi:single-strand DNA-binding protein
MIAPRIQTGAQSPMNARAPQLLGDVNRVSLTGVVCAEPKLFSGGRAPVLKFRLQTTERAGQRSYDNTNTVVAFGELAASLSLVEGDRLAVEGRLQSGSYSNKAGQRIYATEVVASKIGRIEDQTP